MASFPIEVSRGADVTAAETGARVLAALERGRQLAITRARERAAPNERDVRRLLDVDIISGKKAHGRAGRIARALRGRISESGVRKILSRLSSGADSVWSDSSRKVTGTDE